MKDYTLSQQIALICLDAQTSNYNTLAKKAAMRSIAAAQALESIYPATGHNSDSSALFANLESGLKHVRELTKKEAQAIEAEITTLLIADGTLEIVPDLLGCDLNYYTSGISLTAYRTDRTAYFGITERIRAEILEDGPVTEECFTLLWLMRENGCIHDIFSIKEQEKLQERMMRLSAEDEFRRTLWQAEFHSSLESLWKGFLRGKHNLFKNPYLEGINLAFPFLDRRQSIFVDFVIFGTNVSERRLAMIEFLNSKGHYVTEVKNGEETLLEIDNSFYRIFPYVMGGQFPIQGAYLLPVYR